jgi:MFS transporter, DHA1 family, multidrug resistance protein
MVFAPISEMPTIGRNPPYLYSFIAFTVVSIIIASIDNISAIIVLRFFQGFFGSPCLASGAATIDDMYELYHWPCGLAVWVMAIYWGPSFAPLLAAYAVPHNIHCEQESILSPGETLN